MADLPVMMLTAKGNGRDREAAERAGVSRFMTKPFSNDEMRAAVRDLVQTR
jgi:DNA-binding response OmpR family regulator